MGFILSKISIFLVFLYKEIIAPIMFGLGLKDYKTCKYEESCPDYTIRVMKEEKFLKALKLSSKRVLSCHNFKK